MRRIVSTLLFLILIGGGIYFAFIYYATRSEGVRSGELVKFSRQGLLFKTWEGEISQGSSGEIFAFSIEEQDKQVVENMIDYQGKYVKVTYKERFGTFFWLGESKFFIVKVELEEPPQLRRKGTD